jgi:hypothetical protein
MKSLLKITAILEALTGITLVIAPALLVSILLAVPMEESGALIVARVTGLALLSLSIACWQSSKAPAASSIVQAMLFYNVAIASLLIYAATVENISGIGLWPVVILHLGLAIWCAQSLKKGK